MGRSYHNKLHFVVNTKLLYSSYIFKEAMDQDSYSSVSSKALSSIAAVGGEG